MSRFTSAQIQEQYSEATGKLQDAKHAVNIALAEIKLVQARCSHPYAREWKSGDYSGDTYMMVECPDCKLKKQGTIASIKADQL